LAPELSLKSDRDGITIYSVGILSDKKVLETLRQAASLQPLGLGDIQVSYITKSGVFKSGKWEEITTKANPPTQANPLEEKKF
jgi:hypothetical protein